MLNLSAPHTGVGAGAIDGEASPRPAPAVDALVRAVQNGELAFSALYEQYLDRIYAYVRSRTASDDDAADLTQQVFLQALRALPRYRDGGTPFAAWLFRIARNAVIDHQRGVRPSMDWDSLPIALQPVDGQDVEASVLRRERLDRLRALLGRLGQDKRELLALRFAADLTIAEIAVVIGKSEAATKKSLFRTLHALKEQAHDLAD